MASHLTPMRLQYIKKNKTTSLGMEVKERNPHPLLVKMSTGSTFWENNVDTYAKN